MKRRNFIHYGMLGAAMLGAAGCSSMRFRKITLTGKMADFSFDVTHPKPSGTMPTGEIGRTGIKVSKFGFGAHMPQGLVPFEKERRIMIREAYDLGVTLYDVYDDGNWKVYQYEPMGKHLAPMIKDVVISIVMSPYDGRTFEQEFERTLRVFGRDYIDLVRLYSLSHDAGNWDQWEKLLKLKEQGYIRAVGVPIHSEKDIEVVLREIPIDFVLLPYNFYHNILWDGKLPGDFNPLAKKLREKGIGVITMKPFGTDWFVTPLIQAARQLDKTNNISLPLAALRYVINSGLNADATIGGMYNLDHVYENVMAYYNPELSDDERNLLDKVKKVARVIMRSWKNGRPKVSPQNLLHDREPAMKKPTGMKRRSSLKGIGAFGALTVLNSQSAHSEEKSFPDSLRSLRASGTGKKIVGKVFSTPLIDTHEHLFEEKERLDWTAVPEIRCDDWTMVLSLYVSDDMITAGMPLETNYRLFSRDVDPLKKWRFLKPYWPYIKNTGYGRAARISIQELYGVHELSEKTVGEVQSGYEKVRKPGFYRRILCDMANIESCQVNCINPPFRESDMPTLLMQDISFLGMFQGPDIKKYAGPAGIPVGSLSDWHRVIGWWFQKYSRYAVAIKAQNAYSRNIDYEKVPAEQVEAVFTKVLNGETPPPQEKKALEDHLFWYAVDEATRCHLPVKLHTGYYVGHDYMPLSRLSKNPGAASDLCRIAPETTFVFMHICYPYYEELIALAKQYTNAYVDMCWSWIINPVAARDFLKKYLVTAPANKILPFGGDYYAVETILGHAFMARQGIALALSELVEEGWMSLDDALETVDTILHENARTLFNLDEKKKILEHAPWG